MILDGGLSNALVARGHDLSDDLWTAALLRDRPEEVAAVHRAYFAAGAEVATTASYQASVPGYERAGLSRPEAEALVRRSVTLAREVRDELAGDGRRRLVAASVGPYGAVLADGSEYRGRYGIGAARLRDFHLPRLELLVSAGPDLLAVETIPDLDEAAVLVDLLDELGVPAWLSYSCAGDTTRAGQPLAEAFAVVAGSTAVVAAGVNCCAPEDVLPALQTAARVSGRPGVAYPNSGQGWDSGTHSWQGPTAYDVRLAPDWVAAGATYVGGCCEVGPADISALRDVLGQSSS
ncbi:homocysteine S-methyltransferase [Nocardioides panacis]|uniref:Homocysteine S-methyltransferase n=1 Tax=Nocardioides panacis TaxID=2849501 RepID=A0A975XZ66_9ACTN|nr:homocysteine S-methyltransferase [Nocardioides panacis]QWZ07058.1 homocysteine S-methyltransferase [Nocardioides panacis]